MAGRQSLLSSQQVATADEGLLQAFKQAWDKIDNDEGTINIDI